MPARQQWCDAPAGAGRRPDSYRELLVVVVHDDRSTTCSKIGDHRSGRLPSLHWIDSRVALTLASPTWLT